MAESQVKVSEAGKPDGWRDVIDGIYKVAKSEGESTQGKLADKEREMVIIRPKCKGLHSAASIKNASRLCFCGVVRHHEQNLDRGGKKIVRFRVDQCQKFICAVGAGDFHRRIEDTINPVTAALGIFGSPQFIN